MSERPYHHGDLPSALLDAAEALIREKGLDGWSLREASARTGVSPSAAYHHFESRDTLVRALSDRVLARLGERLGRAVSRAGDDPEERIVAFGRSYVRWALDDPAVARLAFRVGSSEAGPPISVHPHDLLAAELDRLVVAGGLSQSARPGADAVVGAAVHGLAAMLLDGMMHLNGQPEVDRVVERIVRAVLNGLGQETADGRWPAPQSRYTDRLSGRRQAKGRGRSSPDVPADESQAPAGRRE